MKKKWIIVTGGAGMIGSALVHHLNRCGHEHLLLVDDLGSDEKWKNLREKRFDDLISSKELFSWLEKKNEPITAIFHLGACSATTESNCSYLLENNYRYTVNLASYAIHNKLRFVYASSAATYGDGLRGFDDDESQLEKLCPLNMYGYSKHLVDLWLHRRGLFNRVVGLKYFNVFGPNEYHKGSMASAVVKMVSDAKAKGVISLFKSDSPQLADGEQVRDFIYVKDAAMMTASFLENDKMGLFNVGSGIAQSWNQLARAVVLALASDIKIQYVEMPEILRGKYQNYTKATMEKWKAAKLPAPTYTLEVAVEDYVRNYLLTGSYL